MGLLKKLFSKQETEESKKTFVDRPPRVHLQPLHRISFRLIESSNPRKLINISAGGMAVIHENDSLWRAGAELPGIIAIEKEEFQIQARVRHLNEALAGCDFGGGENAQLRRAIEAYLRIEILALNLRPVAERFLKVDPRGQTHWFTDGKQNEAFCVTDAKGVVAFHLSFLGHYVEGDRESGSAHVGNIINDPSDGLRGHKGSDLIDMSRQASPETLALATTFLQNLEKLPNELREDLVRSLNPDKQK